jgi:hypothetical protein
MKHKTTEALNITDFWDVMPHSLVDINQRFGEPSAALIRSEE